MNSAQPSKLRRRGRARRAGVVAWHASRRGFTLYEVLVATIVLAVGLVTVLRAVGASLGAEQRAEVVSTVTMLAREKMEEIRKEPAIAVGDDRGDFGDSFPDYYWEAQIRQTAIPGLDQIVVIVHYTINGREDEYVLTSLQREETVPSEGEGSAAPGGGGAMR
ncbi:MAG: prepilin-type N-terminal cleavage/methylation domain-containing protein [Armatimonadota bacterium]